MKWDFRNQLVKVQLNVGSNPNKTFYQYDDAGQRVRKTVVKNGTIQERVYLDGFEIYTERNGSGYQLRRDTIHVKDNNNRIAFIEFEKDIEGRTVESTRYRYQLSNHLGSSVMEIDETPEASIISYEEYYPYGDSAYIAGKKTNGEIAQEVNEKRFRYSGKELDDETGLYYYGARYYAPWMGRWVSFDPIGPADQLNLFVFLHNSPIVLVDRKGQQASHSTATRNLETDLVLELEQQYAATTSTHVPERHQPSHDTLLYLTFDSFTTVPTVSENEYPTIGPDPYRISAA
jgi:RHS repeat-associated protein